ncbi:MAG: DUF1893 domain-containing protein [Ruminococcus sp.]|nr:DUF1893 domain-containing protein [Ruminococcus sp.]
MNEDLKKATEIFEQGGYTCVAVKNGRSAVFRETGVRPLLILIDGGDSMAGCCAADKIVGRAAAFLYCYMGARAVYAETVSRGAVEIFENHGIDVRYKILTEQIVNRQGTGSCPMDTAVSGIASDGEDSPAKALEAIRAKLSTLTID